MFTKKSAKGFTLIELLVVIAIIGILSSVVLASLNTARLKSRDTRRVADIKQIQLALALYFDSNAAYPNLIYGATLAPTYIPAVPKDPSSTVTCTVAGTEASCYKYAGLDTNSVAATCESYHIGATLEETTNQALAGDIDAAAGTICTSSVADFAGTDPIYDQKP